MTTASTYLIDAISKALDECVSTGKPTKVQVPFGQLTTARTYAYRLRKEKQLPHIRVEIREGGILLMPRDALEKLSWESSGEVALGKAMGPNQLLTKGKPSDEALRAFDSLKRLGLCYTFEFMDLTEVDIAKACPNTFHLFLYKKTDRGVVLA